MSRSKTRILLVDDHTLVRRGIAQLLSMEEDMEVVGQAEDGFEAQALAKELHPDLILLDLKMPRCNGLDALAHLRKEVPEAIVLVLTYSADEEDALAALRMGAQGYLLKNLEPEALCAHIRAALHGESPISGQVARNLLLGMGQAEDSEANGEVEEPSGEGILSPREQQIVQLMIQGNTNREIAANLFLSEHTVKNHVRRILSKLQLQNRAQVVAWAIRTESVPNGPS